VRVHDPIKHKEGCNKHTRRTNIIAPVTGFRCSFCGAYTDKYEDMKKELEALRKENKLLKEKI